MILTTGDLAWCCSVSNTTIIRWISKGYLKAFTTPGGHRRVYVDDFVAFLNHYGRRVDLKAIPACSKKPIDEPNYEPKENTHEPNPNPTRTTK